MKEKIIIFIAGLLLGSIISTASIYIYTLANKSNNGMQNSMPTNSSQMNDGNTPPDMPNNQSTLE